MVDQNKAVKIMGVDKHKPCDMAKDTGWSVHFHVSQPKI